jgi:hypothetical protein
MFHGRNQSAAVGFGRAGRLGQGGPRRQAGRHGMEQAGARTAPPPTGPATRCCSSSRRSRPERFRRAAVAASNQPSIRSLGRASSDAIAWISRSSFSCCSRRLRARVIRRSGVSWGFSRGGCWARACSAPRTGPARCAAAGRAHRCCGASTSRSNGSACVDTADQPEQAPAWIVAAPRDRLERVVHVSVRGARGRARVGGEIALRGVLDGEASITARRCAKWAAPSRRALARQAGEGRPEPTHQAGMRRFWGKKHPSDNAA